MKNKYLIYIHAILFKPDTFRNANISLYIWILFPRSKETSVFLNIRTNAYGSTIFNYFTGGNNRVPKGIYDSNALRNTRSYALNNSVRGHDDRDFFYNYRPEVFSFIFFFRLRSSPTTPSFTLVHTCGRYERCVPVCTRAGFERTRVGRIGYRIINAKSRARRS